MVRRMVIRCVTGLVWMLALSVCFNAQDAPPNTVKLSDGTPIHLFLKDDLDSKNCREGDSIRFQVREDVVMGNVVVIPEGSLAHGHITSVSHRGMAGHSGKLGFSIDYVAAPDGTKVSVVSSPNITGGSNGKVTAAATAVFGPGALLMRGWNADIRRGTMLNAYVNGNHDIGMANLTTHPYYPSTSPTESSTLPVDPSKSLRHRSESEGEAPATRNEASTVIVKSTPDGADITVDGKYVGSTPSTLKLPLGDHAITVEKSGFKTWQRTMAVSSGGEISINATLEKTP